MSRKPRRRGPASATAAAVQQYAAVQPSLQGATECYVELITTMLDDAGIKNVYYESPGTAHEWQTWRRSLYQFAPLLFKD